MSTISAPLTDSRIMMRRNLKHILRNPVMIFNAAVMPVVLMLLLVYVFGSAFRSRETKRCKAFAASEGGRSPQIQSTSVAFGTA
jgi:hypothetical protein